MSVNVEFLPVAIEESSKVRALIKLRRLLDVIQEFSELYPEYGDILGQRAQVVVNSYLVRPELWHLCVMEEGDTVLIIPILGCGGGGGCAGVIQIVIGAALLMAGPGGWLGLASQSMMMTAVTVAGISMVASGVMTLLFPGPDVPTFGGDYASADPVYRWDGRQIQFGTGGRVSIVYGKTRVAGQVIMQYIDDASGTVMVPSDKNYLYILLALSHGEIEDLAMVEKTGSELSPISFFANTDTVHATSYQTIIENWCTEDTTEETYPGCGSYNYGIVGCEGWTVSLRKRCLGQIFNYVPAYGYYPFSDSNPIAGDCPSYTHQWWILDIVEKTGGGWVHRDPEMGGDYYVEPYTYFLSQCACYGQSNWTGWLSADYGTKYPEVVACDLASLKLINGVNIVNYHNDGAETNKGVSTYQIRATNNDSLFNNTSRDTIGSWILLASGELGAYDPAYDATDPQNVQKITWVGTTRYRYYAIYAIDNWGWSGSAKGIRKANWTTYEFPDVLINNQPLYNFTGISWEFRRGTWDQTPISVFDHVRTYYSQSSKLTQAIPKTYTTYADDCDEIWVHIRFPILNWVDSGSGDVHENLVKYEIWYAKRLSKNPDVFEDYTLLGEYQVEEKSKSPIIRINKDLTNLSSGAYSVKVIRTSDDEDDNFYRHSVCFVDGFTEVQYDALSYPGIALFGIRILATEQISGATPNIIPKIKGIKVDCPVLSDGSNNYNWDDCYWDPEASTYKLRRNGSTVQLINDHYTKQFTRDPIWQSADLATSEYYGLGKYTNIPGVVYNDLIEHARYGTELVTDGVNTEPRFRCDIQLANPQKALQTIARILKTCRGWVFSLQNNIKIIVDKIEPWPSYVFNEGNIIEKSLKLSFLPYSDTSNAIDVTWDNPEDNSSINSFRIIDEEEQKMDRPLRVSSLQVHGIIRYSHALREAWFHLNLGKHRIRALQFDSSINSAHCAPGDVVRVQLDMAGWGLGGRVIRGTINTITIDQQITLEPGITYGIGFINQEGVFVKSYIVAMPGVGEDIALEELSISVDKVDIGFTFDSTPFMSDSDNITTPERRYQTFRVDPYFSTAPTSYCVWVFGEKDKEGKDFRIVSIRRKGTKEVTLNLIEHNELQYLPTRVETPEKEITLYSSVSSSVSSASSSSSSSSSSSLSSCSSSSSSSSSS